MKFAVIGGDMRQAKLCELLAADGHAVNAFAIDKIEHDAVTVTSTVKDAVDGADCVIFPLPITAREAGFINAPLSAGLHTIREALSVMRPGQVICAGKVDIPAYEAASVFGFEIVDYLEREEFAVLNAIATAEGAIGLIMEETPVTLCRLNCLVIGFGRIGKILCHRLRGLGALVTAAARKHADLAWIKAYGYEALETCQLDGQLHKFDVIINTVPARVIGESHLKELKSGAFCLDLASKPGGLDFSMASKLGVKALWALGLPGEVAPITSGMVVRDTVYNILSEKGFAR